MFPTRIGRRPRAKRATSRFSVFKFVSAIFRISVFLLPLTFTGCGNSPSLPAGASSFTPASAQWFEDITKPAGVNFIHVAGTNYFMPDQVGSGIAVFDFDNDGRLDLYFVQNGGPDSKARNQLFHQQPDGTFRDVSAGSGLDVTGRGMGVIAGDVNNDGLPDVVITEYGAVRLFQNLGEGRFREVTLEAGLDNPRWAIPASFIDYDRDGWLDLAVGNNLDYDATMICHDAQGRQDFCAPKSFGPTVTRLWRNVTRQPGDTPRFEDRTEPSGLTRASGVALGLVCADFDGDGWPDIFIADDGLPNRLFINRRDGTFVEEAALRGLAYNAMGMTAADMGTAFADVTGNGMGDLFVTHLTEEFHSLWKQGPRGLFVDEIARSGLQQQEWRGTGFGAVLADFNCSGAPDLAFVSGSVRLAIAGQTPVMAGVSPWWARYAQRSQLFVNEGGGRFRDISSANPAFCGEALVGRSLAVADLNNDGAPDLIVGGIGGPARVYRNIAPNRGHWVKLRLLDPARGNRDAIGAEVVVRGNKRNWWSLAQPATSYVVSNDPAVHFGLGSVSVLDEIEVLWPDGEKEVFPGGSANRLIVLKQGEGRKL
jgi:enediyne biosynthesis protein E4